MENQHSILSPKKRRQRNRDRNREEMKAAILEAARAVMREEGVAALNQSSSPKLIPPCGNMHGRAWNIT
jgi:hypothetical protein